jgi:DNA gyrase subunit B
MNSIEMVQKRPGMYIGDTSDGTGLHTMLFEIIGNAVNEGLGGHCKFIDVTINKDGSVTVADDGRGIPVDTYPEYGKSAAEIILTHLAVCPIQNDKHSCPKHLRGVGLCVVNALSDTFELQTVRAGKKYRLRYSLGYSDTTLEVVECSSVLPKLSSGTTIRFIPSHSFFSNPVFVFSQIVEYLIGLKFLAAGVNVSLSDFRGEKANRFDIQL